MLPNSTAEIISFGSKWYVTFSLFETKALFILGAIICFPLIRRITYSSSLPRSQTRAAHRSLIFPYLSKPQTSSAHIVLSESYMLSHVFSVIRGTVSHSVYITELAGSLVELCPFTFNILLTVLCLGPCFVLQVGSLQQAESCQKVN